MGGGDCWNGRTIKLLHYPHATDDFNANTYLRYENQLILCNTIKGK